MATWGPNGATGTGGYCYKDASTYSAARSSTTDTARGSTYYYCGQEAWTGPYYDIYQGFIEFDTSGIPDDAVITSVTLTAIPNLSLVDTPFTVNVYANPSWDGGSLVTGDYQGSGEWGSLTLVAHAHTSEMTTDVRHTFTSESAFVNNINRNGYTRFILISKETIDNSAPSIDVQENCRFSGGGYPQLTVVYNSSITVSPSAIIATATVKQPFYGGTKGQTSYTTDFSEYSVGSAPSDWSEMWHTLAGTATIIDAGYPAGGNGQVLKITCSSGDRYALVWDAVGNGDKYVEILAKVCDDHTADQTDPGRVCVLVSGNDTSEYAYHHNFNETANDATLYKYVNGGTATSIGGTISTILNYDTWYWIRLRRDSSGYLKWKIWADGSSEPGSFTQSTSTDSDIQLGYVGVMKATAFGSWLIDSYSVATNEGTATNFADVQLEITSVPNGTGIYPSHTITTTAAAIFSVEAASAIASVPQHSVSVTAPNITFSADAINIGVVVPLASFSLTFTASLASGSASVLPVLAQGEAVVSPSVISVSVQLGSLYKPELDIDGFIVYIHKGDDELEYIFGTDQTTEHVHYVTPNKREIILYGVPTNKYYTIGVQAYRIVDNDIHPSGMITSSIIQSEPVRPTATPIYQGSLSDGATTRSASEVQGSMDSADNAVQPDSEGSGTGIVVNATTRHVTIIDLTGITIRSAAGTGARTVMDSLGFRAYNGSNANTIDISASTGVGGFGTGTHKLWVGDATRPLVYGESTSDTNHFYADASGNAYFAGTLSGSTGSFGSGTHKLWVGNATNPLVYGESTSDTNHFYADATGNIYFKGNISGASGTFSGTVQVGTGNGQITISSTGISVGSGQFSIDVNGNASFSGTMTVCNIDSGTIDGVTITGGTVRTSSSTAKVQMTSSGLASYNSSGTQRVNIDADGSGWFGSSTAFSWNTSGAIEAKSITIKNADSGARIEIKETGLTTYNSSGSSLITLDYTNGIIVRNRSGGLGSLGERLSLYHGTTEMGCAVIRRRGTGPYTYSAYFGDKDAQAKAEFCGYGGTYLYDSNGDIVTLGHDADGTYACSVETADDLTVGTHIHVRTGYLGTISCGSGAPSGGSSGDIYLRTSADADGGLWVNENGTWKHCTTH